MINLVSIRRMQKPPSMVNVPATRGWKSCSKRDDVFSAIGAIALCEAYGITKDEKIKSAALAAIKYTINAQHQQRGGWRYSPVRL